MVVQNVTPSGARQSEERRLSKILGPGLIAGASDDDPSGIGTYSQAGAQLGFAICWTMLFSYPLMAAIQEISGRIGRTTGRGIAGNIRLHYAGWMLHIVVALVLIANTINIGADLGAMGDAVELLVGGSRLAYVVLFGAICVALQVFIPYVRYASVLQLLTLALFSYFATLMVVHVPWAEVAWGFFVPTFSTDAGFWTTVVAILGTTISPYLFFWQASHEVEELRAISDRSPLTKSPSQAPAALDRIRLDTYVGMAFSNLVALAIIVTTAATLHANGIFDIETSAQAAQALRPIAGDFASAVFALGIVGTGLLAVPVLAGSAAYALSEARKWRHGLSREPNKAKAFYATIAVSVLIGILINFSPLNPVKALYWSAVINAVAAVPIMAMMMHMAGNPRVMGKFSIGRGLWLMGMLSTGAMTVAVVAMIGGAAL